MTTNIFNMADTWNNAGTTFTAIKMDVTDTASDVNSLLFNLLLNGASKFSINKFGQVVSDRITAAGGALLDSEGITVKSTGGLHWSQSGGLTDTLDVHLYRDAAGILAQRNSTNAQRLAVYNTFTSSTNRELFAIDWQASANICNIWTEKGSGGGTARALQLGTDGTGRWQIGATTGHLLAIVDNTYDIGASGATRPRNLYIAGFGVFSGNVNAADLQAGNGNFISWATRSAMSSPADGRILFVDSSLADFNRLQFGGTSSSFPALKRNTTALEVRLADDSGYGGFLAGATEFTSLRINQTPAANSSAATTITNGADSASNLGHNISINFNGTTYYIPCGNTQF